MRAYTAGETEVPLLEETIGANFERVAARFPNHDALIEAGPVPGADARRWSYATMNDVRRPAGPRDPCLGPGERGPGGNLESKRCRVDAAAVCHGEGRRPSCR